MSRENAESSIVRMVARHAAELVTRRTISCLRKMRVTLSGLDSGLLTTWDEICVQAQDGESFFWSAYNDTMSAVVSGILSELSNYERQAIWLQTDASLDWSEEESGKDSPCPVCDDDIVKLIIDDYLYPAAESWSNARITAYIDRSSMRD